MFHQKDCEGWGFDLSLYQAKKTFGFFGIRIADPRFAPVYFETENEDEVQFHALKLEKFRIKPVEKIRLLDLKRFCVKERKVIVHG